MQSQNLIQHLDNTQEIGGGEGEQIGRSSGGGGNGRQVCALVVSGISL